MAAIAAFIVLLAGATPFLPLDDTAVRLRIDVGGDPPTALGLREAIEATALGAVGGIRFDAIWPVRPRYTVVATVRTVGDSIHLMARLDDRAGLHTTSLPPRSAHLAGRDAAVRRLADGVVALLIAARAPLLHRWSAQAALPTNAPAMRALEAALSAWRPPAIGEARQLLERAAALDSASGTPLVLLSLALAKAADTEASETVLGALDRSARRQGPWDRAMVMVVRAWNRGDLPAAHAAGHRLVAIAPGSEWVIVPAYDALGVGRARESLELLDALPGDVAWTARWRDIVRHQALMLDGNYAAAFVEAQRGLRDDPADTFFLQSAVKALAALGRVREVEAICIRSLSQRLAQQPCDQAVRALRASGHAIAAQRMNERYLAAIEASGTLDADALLLQRAWGALDATDWSSLRSALAELDRTSIEATELSLLRLYEAASRSDRAQVHRLLRADRSLDPIVRASVLALAGERAAAVEGVAAAFRGGFRRGFSVQIWPGFEQLRGYEPLESMIAPIDDVSHRRHASVSALGGAE